MLDIIWFLVWISSLLPHSFCPYICTLGIYMLKTALSLCYTVELDALPGIWGVAAGLMQV